MPACTIGVVAPSCRMTREAADAVLALAERLYPSGHVQVRFHPQCFLSHNHFAGEDAARAAAFIEVANDPAVDAVWFARGGYGACRIVDAILPRLTETARRKAYLGYSDGGVLLAALYRAGFTNVAHGPIANDVLRDGGEGAVARALAWLADRNPASLEPGLTPGQPAAAFNLTVLSQLLGTPLQPDLSGHVLLLEEVSEHLYRIDRSLFHLTSNPDIRRVAGLRLGRCSQVPTTIPPSAFRRKPSPDTGAKRPASPGWVPPTSAMTPTTRSSRSARLRLDSRPPVGAYSYSSPVAVTVFDNLHGRWAATPFDLIGRSGMAKTASLVHFVHFVHFDAAVRVWGVRGQGAHALRRTLS
jgi:muramoyltetrapeptide carboxypeptidase